MLRFVYFLCAFAASASLSFAQTTPIDDLRANARTHVGPFYITPSIMLTELGVDSNVFNAPVDPKSDFTFTLVPRADIGVPMSHRALIRVNAAAYLVYYQDYASERSVDPRIAPRAELFLNKVSFFAEGMYLRTRQRPSYEIDARSARTESNFGGGVGYRYSPKLAFEGAVRRASVKYDAGETFLNVSLQETLNHDSLVVSGSAEYSLTPLTTIVLRAETGQDRFQYSPVRDADTLRIFPGVEFNARALINGSAYVGVRTFHTKSDALDDFTGVVASAALGYTLFGRTTFVATADRDLTYSFEPLQPYYIVENYGLTIRHRLVGKFDVTGGAARYKYSYRHLLVADPAGAGGSVNLPPRVDFTHNYSGSVGYRLGPDLRVGFGAIYWVRQSDWAYYRDYNDLRIGFSFTYGF